MITRFMRKLVKYRILIMVYLNAATSWNWNAKQECFVPASIYLRWNGCLLLTLGSTFPFLMSTFLLAKLPNEEYMESRENFVVFILGWAEVFIITAILMISLRMKQYWRDIMYLMNEMYRYSDYIEDLMRRCNTHFNRNEQKYIYRANVLLAFVGILSTFIPLAFGACICVRVEPNHALLQEWLEVNISIRPKFIPFILFMIWILMDAVAVGFSAIAFLYGYLCLARSLLTGLTPHGLLRIVQPGSSRYKVTIRYKLNSRYFGVLDEMTVVQIFRTHQVFNTITNDICGSVLFSFHHVACLLAFLGGALTLLKATDEVLDGGPLVVAALGLAVISPLVLQYEESKEISEVCQKSDGIIRRCINLTDRRSMLYKFVKSCPKLKVHAGYPFFNVCKDTFSQFWAQGIDFLVASLAI
ncbi:unnamed protein product [Orchesella dallaii]|uniref:Odorant receptor n=1 Tax=Orchesella dallaii TaxID=48710 RepID=A0ABP1PM01_9HEXA